MNEIGIILIGLTLVGVAGLVLLRALNRNQPPASRDLYLEALETWVAGKFDQTERLLRELIANDPHAAEPYLQLGNLLRAQGKPRKAALLHRSLIARSGLPEAFKIQVGLSLSEDLLAMNDPGAAGLVLDSLVRQAAGMPRYGWARFQQWIQLGDMEEAARVLKHCARHVGKDDQAAFVEARGLFQLDRAFAAALERNFSQAETLLDDVPEDGPAGLARPLVTAVIQVGRDEMAKAMDTAAEGLTGQQDALKAFYAFLRPALLEQGQFARSIPVLERFSQDSNNPISLILALALLHEKIGNREQAVRVLTEQQGRADLTPDNVAGFLSLLIRAGAEADLKTVWAALRLPTSGTGWKCPHCGAMRERLGWFCPSCYRFGPLVSESALPPKVVSS